MKSLKLSLALAAAVLMVAACGVNEPPPNGDQGGNKNATAPESEAPVSEAAALYKSSGCVLCHGADGKGNATMKEIPNFSDPAWQTNAQDAEMTTVIKNGRPPMPAYKTRLTDEQIKELISYLRGFAK